MNLDLQNIIELDTIARAHGCSIKVAANGKRLYVAQSITDCQAVFTAAEQIEALPIVKIWITQEGKLTDFFPNTPRSSYPIPT